MLGQYQGKIKIGSGMLLGVGGSHGTRNCPSLECKYGGVNN